MIRPSGLFGRFSGPPPLWALLLWGSIVLPWALPAAASTAQPVVLQLRWDHQFQFAGYYAARWQGYYDEAGLEVEIRAAVRSDGTILSATEEVTRGRADFGIGAADVLVARDRGAPLVVLAAIFQQSPARFFARRESGLRSPADFPRLRVVRRPGDLIDVEMQAMLRAEGIDPARVEPHPLEVSRGYLDALVQGIVDVIPGYSIGTPHEARALGIDLVEIRPAAYGVDFYGDSLFTHRRWLERDAELVQRFREASLRGWRYALDHPEEVAARISAELPRHFPVRDFDSFLRFQIPRVRALTLVPVVELGHVNPDRWRRMHEVLAESGLVEGRLDLADFLADPEFLARHRARKHRQVLELGLAAALLLGVASLLWMAALHRQLSRRRRAEAAVRRVNRAYRVLGETGELSSRTRDERELLGMLCRLLVESGGYRLAWVGLVDRDDGEVRPVARYGHGEGYVDLVRATAEDTERGRGPSGRAVRSGVPEMVRDIRTDPAFGPWRSEALQRGFGSSIALPLSAGGEAFGVLNLYAAEPSSFDPEETGLLARLAQVVASGVEALRDREARERAEVELRAAYAVVERRVRERTRELAAEVERHQGTVAALRRSEDRFRTVFERAGIGIALVDLEGRVLDANPALCRMLGYRAEELAAMSPADFTHPDDLALDFDRFQRLLEGAIDRYQLEKRYLRRDGRVLWGRLTLSGVRDDAGRVRLTIGMVEDVTARRRAEEALRHSEELFREFVEGTDDLVTRVDREGRLTYVNHVARRIFGLPPEACAGLSAFEFVHPEDRARTERAFASWRTEGCDSVQFENRQVSRSGEVHHLLWTVNLHYDPAGEISWVNGIAADVTERKQAESALQAALAEKELLLKEVHHRVKNNLQLVTSLIRLQTSQIRDAAVRKALGECEDRVRAMATVHTLLYRSPDLARIDWQAYCQRLADGLLHSHGTDRTRVRVEVAASEVSLGVDQAVPCGLAVNELLANALEHAFPEGRGGTVAVTARIHGGDVEVEVADDGVGLPVEVGLRGGPTLGLELVADLVEKQLRGTIELVRDGGARGRICFPLRRERREEPGA